MVVATAQTAAPSAVRKVYNTDDAAGKADGDAIPDNAAVSEVKEAWEEAGKQGAYLF